MQKYLNILYFISGDNNNLQVGPVFLYILRRGCNGHLAKVQPAYDSYIATGMLLLTFLFIMISKYFCGFF